MTTQFTLICRQNNLPKHWLNISILIIWRWRITPNVLSAFYNTVGGEQSFTPPDKQNNETTNEPC